MLTREMSRLQTELSGRGWDDVMLVSISVDPANDTPEALTAYAAKHGAKLDSWQFLTGTRDGIWSLSVDGFKLPVQEIEDTGRGSDPAQQPLRTCGWPAADPRLLRRLRCRRSRQVAARSRNRPRRAHVGDPLTREPIRLSSLCHTTRLLVEPAENRMGYGNDNESGAE